MLSTFVATELQRELPLAAFSIKTIKNRNMLIDIVSRYKSALCEVDLIIICFG